MADGQTVDIKRHVDAACKVVDLHYSPPQLALRAGVEKAMLALVEELRDAFLDESMEKLLAMSDEQVSALCRLEGHDPADEAKLAHQVFKIVQLRIALEGATAALENMSDFWAYGMVKAAGAEADEHDTP
jgi:hypothetical protein